MKKLGRKSPKLRKRAKSGGWDERKNVWRMGMKFPPFAGKIRSKLNFFGSLGDFGRFWGPFGTFFVLTPPPPEIIFVSVIYFHVIEERSNFLKMSYMTMFGKAELDL